MNVISAFYNYGKAPNKTLYSFTERKLWSLCLELAAPAHYVSNITQIFIFCHHPGQEADRVNIVLGIPKLCYRLYVAVDNRERERERESRGTEQCSVAVMLPGNAASLCVSVLGLFLRQLVGCSVSCTFIVQRSRWMHFLSDLLQYRHTKQEHKQVGLLF